MSKILSATCDANGKVSVAGKEVPDALVLSLGKQSSEGALLLDELLKIYVTSSATDIKTVIEKLSALITQISTTLTSIGAGMTGPTTAPPPTLASDVAMLTSIKVELDTLKESLK